MQNHNQENIIEKINLFFTLDKRDQQFIDGYCHGLTLLWLYKMRHNQEESFYNVIKKICAASSLEDFKAFEKDLEEFIYHIEWLQNAHQYEDDITQTHIEELEKTKVFANFSYLFTHDQIKLILTEIFKTKNMLAISAIDHTIGVFKKENDFLLYDSNYFSGRHQTFNSIQSLKDEILKQLFQLNALLISKFPMIINVFQNKDEEINNDNSLVLLHQKIIDSKKIPDEIGLEGNTDTLLASENGNTTQMTLLLAHGCNPNQKNPAGFTPLFLATTHNFLSTVEVLLKQNANPNGLNLHNCTALMSASAFGLDHIIQILFAYGADPLLESNDGQTALNIALLREHWRSALLLMEKIPSINDLNKDDLDLLTRSLGYLKNAIANHPEDFTVKQKARFAELLIELQQDKPKMKIKI